MNSCKRKHPTHSTKPSKKLRTEPRKQFTHYYMSLFHLVSPCVAIGSLGPIKYGSKDAKIGRIQITEADVINAINEVALVPLYPVCLQSRNLQKHLFNSNKSFTEIRQSKSMLLACTTITCTFSLGEIGVNVVLDKAISLSGILKKFSPQVIQQSTRDIRSLIIPLILKSPSHQLRAVKNLLTEKLLLKHLCN